MLPLPTVLFNDPKFRFCQREKADLVVRASDNIEFYCESFRLAAHSTFFQGVINFDQDNLSISTGEELKKKPRRIVLEEGSDIVSLL